ncbi:hypothetical protein DAY19_06110 [Halobacteriovorax vibrionivorans]|uniref:DUF5723 domain-containing protein n=1 Tax=Halobacteriovorax vibrionivorans TaxID=2152716 RepID=A0ABY0IE93_9BACT|nr:MULTISPECIES: hypothetical protein [Halobacteriovorax]RZF21254.1 hypothetical protein DAY19_06110 [Halobacteriovorax vibrionivorans]TGD47988.1 hypothetical protein EP118_06020 [Halobacteriovorax sp. Y22]
MKAFVLFIFFSIQAMADLSLSYNDFRLFKRPISQTKPISETVINLHDPEKPIAYNAVLKMSANILSYSENAPHITPESFDWSNIGLFPIFNSYLKLSKNFENYEDYKNYKIKIPFYAKDINSWNIGDSIYFNVVGGLGLYLTTGIGASGLGPKVYAEGGYSIYVEKKSENEVFVEIQRVFSKSISLLAGTWGVFAETSRLHQATSGINFLIDISTQQGQEAYHEIVTHGDATIAQEKDESIVKTGKVKSDVLSLTNKAALVTPFIPFIEFLAQKQLKVYKEERNNIWNQESNKTIITRGHSYDYRLFSKKGVFNRQLTLNLNNNKLSSAKYEIYREKNHFRTHSLQLALNKLERYTDQAFFKDLSIDFQKQRLGYAIVKAEIELGPTIIKNFKKLMNEDDYKSSARKFRKYFRKGGFDKLLKVVKNCGGSLKLLVQGEKITNHQEVHTFPLTNKCELTY